MSIYCCTYFNKEVFKQIEVNVDLIYFTRQGILKKINFHLHKYPGSWAPITSRLLRVLLTFT